MATLDVWATWKSPPLGANSLPDESTPCCNWNHCTSGSASSPCAGCSSTRRPSSGCSRGLQAAVVANSASPLTKESWLLIPAGHRLTFVEPAGAGVMFRSQALTLLAPPPGRVAGRGPSISSQATGHQGDVGPRLLLRSSRHHHGAAALRRPRPSCCKGFGRAQEAGGLGLLFPATTTMTPGGTAGPLPQREPGSRSPAPRR